MNILFVCTGNTCRSPMAQGYLESKNIPELNVKSRGLSADGSPVSENAQKVMAQKGIDISWVSEPLTLQDLIWADKIIYMSLAHKTVLSLYVGEEKLFMLGGGISDPFGGTEEDYRICRDEIFAAIDKMERDGLFYEMQVKQVERQHIKEIAKLEKVCFSTPWSEETLMDAFKTGTKFFVAEKGGRVLGYIGISVVLDEGYITNVAVFPEYRKQGTGRALLERVFALAKDKGLSFVSLEVRQSNTDAISLYSKLGFKQEGQRKNFYSDPKEDALIFTKRFED